MGCGRVLTLGSVLTHLLKWYVETPLVFPSTCSFEYFETYQIFQCFPFVICPSLPKAMHTNSSSMAFLSSSDDANQVEHKVLVSVGNLQSLGNNCAIMLHFYLKYSYEFHTYSFILQNIYVCMLKYIHLKYMKSHAVVLCYVSFTKLEAYLLELTCLYVSGLRLSTREICMRFGRQRRHTDIYFML